MQQYLGDKKPFLTALISLDEEPLTEMAQANEWSGGFADWV